MPAKITTIEPFIYEAKQYFGILVALANKEVSFKESKATFLYSKNKRWVQVHLYKEQFLVDIIMFDDLPDSIRFGRFGREEGAFL